MSASVVVALALFSGTAILTGWAVDGGAFAGPTREATAAAPGFLEIWGRNLAAALLLFSGVATAGVTAVCGLVGVGAFVGGTMEIAVHHAGWAGVAGSTWPYVLLEFGGVVLAAAAGLHPVVSAVLTRHDGTRRSPVRRYLSALTSSLWLLGGSTLCITTAAAVETLVISRR